MSQASHFYVTSRDQDQAFWLFNTKIETQLWNLSHGDAILPRLAHRFPENLRCNCTNLGRMSLSSQMESHHKMDASLLFINSSVNAFAMVWMCLPKLMSHLKTNSHSIKINIQKNWLNHEGFALSDVIGAFIKGVEGSTLMSYLFSPPSCRDTSLPSREVTIGRQHFRNREQALIRHFNAKCIFLDFLASRTLWCIFILFNNYGCLDNEPRWYVSAW